LNGAELKAARRRLGISRVDLARILVVATTTVYRWEDSLAARIDPLQRELALLLLGISASPEASAYGEALTRALSQGPTYALHVLLSIAYNDWKPTDAT
jgi:transcriptional regulator with XRE-family HTH domain